MLSILPRQAVLLLVLREVIPKHPSTTTKRHKTTPTRRCGHQREVPCVSATAATKSHPRPSLLDPLHLAASSIASSLFRIPHPAPSTLNHPPPSPRLRRPNPQKPSSPRWRRRTSDRNSGLKHHSSPPQTADRNRTSTSPPRTCRRSATNSSNEVPWVRGYQRAQHPQAALFLGSRRRFLFYRTFLPETCRW